MEYVKCYECDGDGYVISGSHSNSCRICGNTGKISLDHYNQYNDYLKLKSQLLEEHNKRVSVYKDKSWEIYYDSLKSNCDKYPALKGIIF